MLFQGTPFSRNRTNDHPPPFGWTITTNQYGNAVWRCPHISKSFIDGKPRRCTKFYRKNEINVNHNHVYNLPRDIDPGFPTDYDQKEEKLQLKKLKDAIANEIALISGQLDISANKGASNEMFIFVSNILKLGKQIYSNYPNFDPRPDYIKFSTNTLSEKIIDISKKTESSIIEHFQEDIKYVNLLTDTGTFNGFSVLHFIALNPNFPMDIWPIDNFENQNFTADQYSETINNVIGFLNHNDIEVVSIIADSQSAQTKGIIQYIFKSEGMNAAIYHIPCLNHITNLVFAELITLEEFHPYLDIIDYLINFCRIEENKIQINDTCPTLIKTRWVYLYDVLSFLQKNINKINLLLTGSGKDQIPIELLDLEKILQPLKFFSDYVESRSTKLAEILPAISAVTKKFSKIRSSIITSDGIFFLDFIIRTFIARMLSFPQSVLKASFAVSLPGRSKIRQMEKGFSTRGNITNGSINESQVNVDMFSLLINPDQSEEQQSQEINQEEINHMNQTISNISEELEQISNNFDEVSLIDSIDIKEYDELSTTVQLHLDAQELLQVTSKRYLDFSSLRNKFNSINIKTLEKIDWFTNLTIYAQKEITNQAAIFGYQDSQRLCSLYQNWVFTAHSNNISEILFNDSNDSYWRRYHQIDAQLSHICLRLCSLGVSEAEVERMLSVQKNIFSPHATNVGTDMLHARCVIRASINKK